MKSFKRITVALVVTITLACSAGCGSTTYTTGLQYSNPSWAPAYHQGVRYYYLPDIEMYYDLSNQEFVYMDNGQWLYTHTLPPYCSNYDLYSGFIVALNLNVFQPWVHHKNYVSHYPKYYYHDVYRNTSTGAVRGFDENERKPIYWRPEERERVNSLPNRNYNDNNKRPAVSNPPQKNNYDKRNLGKPVKVKPNMREGKPDNKDHKRGG